MSFSIARVVVTVLGLAILAWSAWGLRAQGPGRRQVDAAAPTGAPARWASTRASSTGGPATPTGAVARSFGAAVVIAVLISPAVYQHYLALLVLPLVLGLGAGVPLRYLAVAYVLMWGGKQDALGDLAWIVNRGFPTIGALVLLAGLVVSRRAGLLV